MARAQSLDEVRSFLLPEFNSDPMFYSSEIKQQHRIWMRPPTLAFDCILVRRRRALVDASLIFEIVSVEILVGVVTALVNCSTWTNAKFEFVRVDSSDLGDMFEVCHLLGSSLSLLCLHVSCNMNFWALAEAVVGGVSPNSALKSLTLHTSHMSYKFEHGKALEALFTSATMSSVKELALGLPYCRSLNLSIENLVRCNTNLEKLTLCSTDPKYWVQLKDVTYSWTSNSHGRALHVNFSEINLLSAGEYIEPLAAKFSVEDNPDGIFPRDTDISTLRISLSSNHLVDSCNWEWVDWCKLQWVQAFRDSMLLLVTSVASMSARSTTLKHVEMSIMWSTQANDMTCNYQKLVELLTEERLRKLVRNELGANTSLETLEVGSWKLIRRVPLVGGGMDEWHTSYGGPCLRRPTSEYVVKVQM